MEEQTTKEQTTTEATKEQPTKEQSPEWLQEEAKGLSESAFDGERKPSLKLEENKIVELTIDFSEPFQIWKDPENEAIKKIIPVHVGEVDLVWWLNVKNPIYHQIIEQGVEGKTKFKVLQTGTQKNTKYTLVE